MHLFIYPYIMYVWSKKVGLLCIIVCYTLRLQKIRLIFKDMASRDCAPTHPRWAVTSLSLTLPGYNIVLLGDYPAWLELRLLWPDHTCRASTATLHYWFHISTQIILLKKYLSYNGNYNIWDESCELNISFLSVCICMCVCVCMYTHHCVGTVLYQRHWTVSG